MPHISALYFRGGIAAGNVGVLEVQKKYDIYKFICIFSTLLHFSILLVRQQWEGWAVNHYPQLTTMRKGKGGQPLPTINNNAKG